MSTSRHVPALRDVVYAQPTGFRPLALDLYLPAGEPLALCLYLHGGGWRIGSRRDGPGIGAQWTPSLLEAVADLGVTVAAVDYRLSGEAQFPAQLDDVRAAATFLDENARQFGLSTAPIAVWGASAGAHLAALHALTAPPGQVASAVCWYPPTDLETLPDDIEAAGGKADRGPGSREVQLVGGSAPELLRAASPTVAVGTTTPPPFLFVHGRADLAVPPRQSERLAEALRTAGGQADVELVDGGTHGLPELEHATALQLVQRCAQFMVDTARRAR